jgi:hypothetical protein
MIITSTLFCAILPMIIRLSIARREYHHEFQDFARYLYIQADHEIPFIDDINKEDDTIV